MRFIKAHFENLVGIYNKSGITTVDIDFTKCKHDLIYITGPNGSGKSTLMDALQPLPDSPSMYINGKTGKKELEYYNDGIKYKIIIIYPVGANGNRLQTKAFFQINSQGVWDELNPNGNIGTFKDVVSSKFGLDANFLSLSKLSIENRGIVDKKPSERKKYVSDILDYTEAYNDIHKALSKRSTIFKSMINTLTAKIDSIGNADKLKMEIETKNLALQNLTTRKNELLSLIGEARSIISLFDPKGELQSKYEDLVVSNKELQNRRKLVESVLNNNTQCFVVADKEGSIKLEYSLRNDLNEIINKIAVLRETINMMFESKEEDARLITIKSSKLATLQSEYDYAELKRMIAESTKKKTEMEVIIKKVGYTGVFNISKDEYVLGLQTLKSLRESALNIQSYASDSHIQEALNYIESNSFDLEYMDKLTNDITTLNSQLSEYREKFQYYKGLSERLDILQKRPTTCNIDSCEFIKSAVEAQSQEPQQNMDKYQVLIINTNDEIISLEKKMDSYRDMKKVYEDLQHIIRAITVNKGILKKLPNGKMFTDTMEFINRLRRGDTFNDIYDLYQYINYANVFDEYTREVERLTGLENNLKVIKNKAEVVEDLMKEIEQLQSKLQEMDSTISKHQSEISELNANKLKLETMIEKAELTTKYHTEIESIDKQLSEQKQVISVMNDSISKISASIEDVNRYNTELIRIDRELAPLAADRDACKFSLTQLQEYTAELQEFTDQYNMIELCKKYSSPTKGGIQLLFMKLYMDKTLQLSNQLLEYFFDGQLKLLPYQINDAEFRIPCTNTITNMVNDDISSCSTAERFMISMIMSFAMKFQSSSTYNIISLDEFNGTLDAKNKLSFPIVLDKIRSILSIEQCLMVSQTMEQELSNLDADVISLGPVFNESLKGNIIFQL